MSKRLTVPFALALLVTPGAAYAQERGQTGVIMGYPAVVGFVWHLSDNFAIRPDVALTRSSNEIETSGFGLDNTSSSENWNVAVGIGALWYVARFDNVRTYFVPRVAFGRSSTDSSGSTVGPVTVTTAGASAAFGAQFTPARKFSVFGEVGYGFNRGTSKLETSFATSKSTTWAWSPRTSVGVIFYFGRN